MQERNLNPLSYKNDSIWPRYLWDLMLRQKKFNKLRNYFLPATKFVGPGRFGGVPGFLRIFTLALLLSQPIWGQFSNPNLN